MRVLQYAYFSLRSEHLSAEEIGERVGLAADESRARGDRRADPPIPNFHTWKIVHGDRTALLDEQIDAIVERLTPYAAAIGELVGEGEVAAMLQLVRYFGDPDGVDRDAEGVPDPLGWFLERPVIEFLATTGAELDVDEYGLD